MKRAVKALFIAVYFAVLIYIFVGMALSGYVDFDHMNIYFGEVPKGTAFADILLKDSSDELRLDLDINTNFNYCALVGLIPDFDIGENSEIVRYNEDDYRSLMFNHTDYGSVYLEGLEIARGENDDYMCFGGYTQPILKHFRHIKVAYCDKDGNILGITEEKKITPVYLREVQYEFDADGEELSCRLITQHIYFQIWLLLLFMLILGVVILMRMPSSKNTEHIQSGEVDNESGKQD
jgi:hypothetical protein